MAISLKDVKAAASALPHPKDWEASRMETLHRCEDGEHRRIRFEFKFVDAFTESEVADRFMELVS